MKEINFIDNTLRDGHQSLWATRMTPAHMLSIARILDEAGFYAVELMGTVQFDACIRYLREDPWERIRLLREAMPRTPLSGLIRSKSLTSFNIVPDSVIELWVRRCAANGLRRIMIFDALHDWSNLELSVKTAKAEGIEVVVPLVYSLSPVHTDAFYEQKSKEMIQRLKPDMVMIKDSISLLTVDRTRTLVPAIKKCSFINALTTDKNNVAIVKTIIALSHDLSLDVTAEGIETTEQMEAYRALKGGFAQGFLISRPVDGKAIENILHERSRTH